MKVRSCENEESKRIRNNMIEVKRRETSLYHFMLCCRHLPLDEGDPQHSLQSYDVSPEGT